MIINSDCLDALKELEDNSIDLIATDPPYGYSFMGKDWDKAVPSVDIWKECLRVLKAGAFCFVMSAPRSDVQNAMISRLMEAGFRLDFTPIYWTYASGFPKAGNIGKMVDKRLGAVREVIGVSSNNRDRTKHEYNSVGDVGSEAVITKPHSDQAKALDGSYAGYQPKPAVEVIIVAMKPLSEKTYVDQAMKNGKGITWLDDVRVPTAVYDRQEYGIDGDEGSPTVNDYGERQRVAYAQHNQGRFPANLLVSDDVLNDGVERKTGNLSHVNISHFGGANASERNHTGDSGSYSRYFDLDKWYERNNHEAIQKTDNVGTTDVHPVCDPAIPSCLPFLIVPKASKSEKNDGLEHYADHEPLYGKNMSSSDKGTMSGSKLPTKNFHPTVKPLKLMSYLITLGSRRGDTVLDPFVGSGTTAVAAKILGRIPIGIERYEEYAEIARARLDNAEEYTEPVDNQMSLL